jgi:endonuclease/exonuclease/phosphatase family metal-dependent hydrolase
MTASAGGRDDQFRLAVMNLEHGGVRGASDAPWRASMTVARDWEPDVVLLQEMCSPAGKAAGLRAHLWRTANELGMIPVLGPPTPQTVTANHPAILVSRDLDILDDGPPLWDSGGGALPAWCYVLVQVPGLPFPLALYSVHLPARCAQEQQAQAQRLASLMAQSGAISVAGGDWNCLPPGDYSQDELAAMPEHLRPSRMRTRRRDDGTIELAGNLAVHETMTGVGLVDLTASVPAARRDPSELGTTSVHGGGRIDRDYATDGVQDAVVRHVQMATGGSDHHARLTIMSKTALASRLTPREPTP